jgi:MoaA/NifB/PqqE/SkfB family radical SAM enzyme
MNLTPVEQESRLRLKAHKPLVYDKIIHYATKLERGQSVAMLNLQYSYLCNFHCSHCLIAMSRDSIRPSITPAGVKNLCDQADALGLAHFCLTGGEPLAFPDLGAILTAIGTDRFHVQVDSNGFLLTDLRAEWLAERGVDKIQLSLDGLDASTHDAFRNKPGSHAAVMRAIAATMRAGMGLQIGTVATHERVNSKEFEAFLDFMDAVPASVYVMAPKLCGEWEGRLDLLWTDTDAARVSELGTRHKMTTHLSSGWGLEGGCLAVRRIVNINPWGDVMPCPGMPFSLGNFLDTPLADILKKGMRDFGKLCPVCLTGQNEDFNRLLIARTYGQEYPVPIEKMWFP